MKNNFSKYLLYLFLFFASFQQVKGNATPVLIGLNYSDLLAVKEDIANGKTETVAAYNRVISIANSILKKTALKVTDGVVPVSGNVHDFYTISSYAWPNPDTQDGMPWIYKDGYINDAANGEDYDLNRYNTTIYYIKTLSLAWFYSGDEIYANKAAELLRVWFINEESRMTPAFEYTSAIPGVTDGRYAGVIYGVALIDMIDFINLLSLSVSWSEADNNALKQWFSEYIQWLTTSDFGIKESNATNNHSVWYCAQLATFSIYLGNFNLANTMVEKGKFHLAQQMDFDGSLPRELGRTRSFHYSYYGLDAFATLANCGVISGTDLWNYELSDGRNFKKAFDFFIPYITKEKNWTWTDIDSNTNKDVDRISSIFMVRSAKKIYNTNELIATEDYIASIAPYDNEKVWLMGRNTNYVAPINTTLYVSTQGDDSNDGLSWEHSKKTLHAAYSESAPNAIIYIAAGIYDFATPIAVNKSITILGGCIIDNNSSAVSRPLKVGGKYWEYENETTFNGTLYSGSGSNTDNRNSKLIHIGNGTGEVIIDGIIFQNGEGKYSASNELGGAISHISGSGLSIKLSNCIFKNNSVTKFDNSTGGMGGAVYLRENAEVINCYFLENFANGGSSGGGALYSQPTSTTNTVNIIGCLFEKNSSNISGAGVRTNGVLKTTIEKSIFVNNTAKDGTTFKNGAALYCSGTASGTLAPSTDEINNCLFYNNEGNTSVILSGTTMRNCTYVNNIGSLRISYEGSGKLHNNVLWGNKTTTGSAIGFEFTKTPQEVKHCASDFQIQGTFATNCITLSVSNTSIDGPNFITPTNFSGYGNLTGINPDWNIAETSALKSTGALIYANGTTDIIGNNRPVSGTSCSIGAYEFIDTVSFLSTMKMQEFNVKVSGNNLIITYENKMSVKVFNTNGQLLISSPLALNHILNLKNGVYIVQLETSVSKDALKVII